MSKIFARVGVSFRYPDDWTVERDETDGDWSVTVSSPITAFFMVTSHAEAESPFHVVEEIREALKAEYPEMDVEDAVQSVAGQPAIGHDYEFLTLDTPTTCFTRSLNTTDGPLLILGQVSELDRAEHWPKLREMLESFAVEME